ncbi:glycine cleavage system aminomethyltransferase GcvT [Candidatus Berkiella aquae]|uniref:Aminomethyltransferase n=1 Tax=Candidatus Berkiella aquae TaxID=295108 RepID=A0A0Q9YN76_9GAMM|nr:glycine cleavage system aminomethyltransferase GcvT [Candidatus Berkiella aquae]MCS5712564.1 glycine cleavage system aminomethyltransferase GcvT [Candidatus Berkiella aquae]
MEKSTPLYHKHLELGAMMVPFAGWLMPLHYGSQLEEHHAVRNDVGVFDVSHMRAIDIQGMDAMRFLRQLLANDIRKIPIGKALYTCMLNEQAGIIDDLIVYHLGDNAYRCVVNAGTTDKDWEWFLKQAASFEVTLTSRDDLSLLALQGPNSFDKLAQVLPSIKDTLQALSSFQLLSEKDLVIAKTGYTGEMGVELMIPNKEVAAIWDNLIAQGVRPIGLAARDSLRLEAGLNLYGVDMDENVTPDESNLSWTIDLRDLERHFIGKEALLAKRQQGVLWQLTGIMLLEKGVCRPDMTVHVKDENNDWQQGKLTSGSFSPTLACGIGLARLPIGSFTQVNVEIRGKQVPAKLIKPPFVRKQHG